MSAAERVRAELKRHSGILHDSLSACGCGPMRDALEIALDALERSARWHQDHEQCMGTLTGAGDCPNCKAIERMADVLEGK